MSDAVPWWLSRPASAVGRLAERPWALYFAALAVNALARPYGGVMHDARLYAGQVLNRLDGRFGADLFFRYGSQDRFSLFSAAVAPVVRVLGPENGFFVLYLGFSALLLLAAQRLLTALFRERLVVAASLLWLAATPVGYGGHDVFQINENFVTARLPAVALGLFALERAVRGRWKTALALLAAAGLVHPLMAAGAALTCAAWWSAARLGWRRTLLLAAAGVTAAAAVLAWRPLGARLFGDFDGEWRDCVRDATPMNFAVAWGAGDWLTLAFCFILAAVLAATHDRDDRAPMRFALSAALVGAAAAAAALFVCVAPYALPFQVQPYRWLWVLRLLQAPLTCQVIADLGRRLVAWLRLPAPSPGMLRAAAATVGVAFLAWATLRVAVAFVAPEVDPAQPPAVRLAFLLGACGLAGWIALALAAVPTAEALFGLGLRFRVAAAGAWLMLQTAAFVLLGPGGPFDARPGHHADVGFVRTFLDGRRPGDGRTATVYYPDADLGDVWLTARACCFFDRWQLAGSLFDRRNALEGRRRAGVVRAFEMERYRQQNPSATDGNGPPPSDDDLAALCREDGMDFVIVTRRFAFPCAADNGRVFIYDCREVRAASDGAAVAWRAPDGRGSQRAGPPP